MIEVYLFESFESVQGFVPVEEVSEAEITAFEDQTLGTVSKMICLTETEYQDLKEAGNDGSL